MKLVYILLAIGLIKCIIFYKVYHSVPLLELKRRARTGDKRASAIYKVASYQATLEVLLWALGTGIGAVLIIWSARTSWWLAAGVMVITAWLMVWGRFPEEGWAGGLVAFLAKPQAAVLAFVHPVLRPLTNLFPPARRVHIHTGLFERKDLIDLLGRQKGQVDNRIPPADLKIASNTLTFGDKSVGSLMTPRREVKMVGQNDSIGPLLMDELHKSGFSRFPVVKDSAKGANPQIIGTLYLNSLIDYEGRGKVKDLASKGVYFINEDSNLRQALSAFLKTHHHLLIVINNFEEMSGVLSLEDVLEQILGKEIIDEFDSYENLRAVASQHAAKEHQEHDESLVAPPSE
jgi:CBS domain containing-hemolysin-like protein